jgi:hypothetical protein
MTTGGRQIPHCDGILITGVKAGEYACSHEAFSLVIDEVPLDLPDNAAEFLLTARFGRCRRLVLVRERLRRLSPKGVHPRGFGHGTVSV